MMISDIGEHIVHDLPIYVISKLRARFVDFQTYVGIRGAVPSPLRG